MVGLANALPLGLMVSGPSSAVDYHPLRGRAMGAGQTSIGYDNRSVVHREVRIRAVIQHFPIASLPKVASLLSASPACFGQRYQVQRLQRRVNNGRPNCRPTRSNASAAIDLRIDGPFGCPEHSRRNAALDNAGQSMLGLALNNDATLATTTIGKCCMTARNTHLAVNYGPIVITDTGLAGTLISPTTQRVIVNGTTGPLTIIPVAAHSPAQPCSWGSRYYAGNSWKR